MRRKFIFSRIMVETVLGGLDEKAYGGRKGATRIRHGVMLYLRRV